MLGSGGAGLHGLCKPAVLSVIVADTSLELEAGGGHEESSTEALKTRPRVIKELTQYWGRIGQSTANLLSGPAVGPNLSKNRMGAGMREDGGTSKITKPGCLSWPQAVRERWDLLNHSKSGDELGLLSWNVNGRLDLRGCRESLLRRWALKGFVDVGLIQEHFRPADAPLFDLFGLD